MQLVVLSARPDTLAETLVHIRQHMSFITDALACVPASRFADFAAIDGIDLVSDEDVTGLPTHRIQSMDHQTRNATIRRELARHAAVDEVFLMADDDARPLKPVGEDMFIDTGGRHRLYTFYDLTAWPGRSTDFDEGQHVTAEVLGYLGCERRAFASHMPQIVRKDLFDAAWSQVEAVTDTKQLCEWAVYGNVARMLEPDRFTEPSVYLTLCWPMYPGEWPFFTRPTEYVFENFYPHLYEQGGLFAGLPTALDADNSDRHAMEKILRWSAFGRRAAALDFPDGVDNPWIQGSRRRRAAFAVLRRFRAAYRYIAQEDQARLAELSGTVEQLRDEVRKQ